ncbi:MAG TPA: M20 family metallopeptidase [Candidatus Saccharimonadales bacterium]|nr:M20 family metallopeptidase [Candidatus Saccharimonadales bacterium]
MSQEKFVELLSQLVAIESVASNKQALHNAVDFIGDLIKDVPNVTIEKHQSNGVPSLLAYKGNRTAKFDILLNAHVDVVPADPSSFKVAVKDGRIYGRGVLDMKGTAIALAQVFKQAVNNVPYNLGLQIVSDEEVGGQDGVNYYLKNGLEADFVILGEYNNTKNTIYNAARGICWIEVGFKGESAHGAHLWHGSNAIVKASEFVTGILKCYPTPKAETWTTTANIATISTENETYNKVPDKAKVKIDFRFTQEDPNFKDKQSVKDFVKSIHPEAELLQFVNFEPSVHVEELNPYVQGLSSALQKVTGSPVSYKSRPGGSDGRHFAAKNIDVVEFGLYGEGSHSPNEYIETSSFTEYVSVLNNFLQNPKSQVKVEQNERSSVASR